MQISLLPIEEFLKQLDKKEPVLFDTRSEKEYEKAHIPGAVSLPLLNNEHRQIIGTVYKNEGREAAVIKGFELVGPLFHEIIKKATKIAAGKEVFLYCWRGGMRSNITAWLLKMAGLKVTLLKDGYKAYRHWVIDQFNKPLQILVLGGKTGSGKTEILTMLKELGQQTIDLEFLASHKGSAFGLLGMPPQPSQEHFENLLGKAVSEIASDKIVWVENESRVIGKITVPNLIFERMRIAKVVDVQVIREQRVDRILKEYCVFPGDLLAEHTRRIEKRLGGQHVKVALEHLYAGNMIGWLDIVLEYYDRTYAHSNSQRDESNVFPLDFNWENTSQCLKNLIKATN